MTLIPFHTILSHFPDLTLLTACGEGQMLIAYLKRLTTIESKLKTVLLTNLMYILMYVCMNVQLISLFHCIALHCYFSLFSE